MKHEYRFKDEKDCKPLHYDWCGLDDIYLLSGFKRVPAEDGEDIVIQNMDDLHKAIALNLAQFKKALSGKEIRFLRHEMDLTQSQLGQVLGVTDQSVARWEKKKGEPIPGPAELVLRLLYLAHASLQVDVRELAESLRTLDSPVSEKLVFKRSKAGWKAIAA